MEKTHIFHSPNQVFGGFLLLFTFLLKQAFNVGLVPISLGSAGSGRAPEEEMVRAEGVQWELGAGLGNPGGFSNASGWSLREQLVALVGIPAEDEDLGAGGRESSKGGEETPEKGEERRIIRIRSN